MTIMSEPDKILEGEILKPGESRSQYQEQVFVRVREMGWLAKLLLAMAGLGFIMLALFLSFWIAVLSLPVIAAIAIWSWAARKLR